MRLSTFHCRLLFYLLGCTLLFLVAFVDSSAQQKAEVELLIVCDKEFSDRFQHDRQKMIDYWKVYMWDIDMKFKTLETVDISFRVTSLIIINNTEDQPFIEQARKFDGRVPLELVYANFQSWLYANENHLTGFDIGLLVTGASPVKEDESLSSKAEGNTVCLKSHSEKLHKSSLVLHSSGAAGNTCSSFESAIALMLGAPLPLPKHCSPSPDLSECDEDYFVMSDKSCNHGQYFFSECSDKGITKLMNTSQGSCLRESAAPRMDVLKLSKVTHPPTLEDQCAMLTKSNKSTLIKGENDCVNAKCSYENNEESTSTHRTLIPLDNSPCDSGKFCFRGRCLPQGHLLRNVATGKCLRSGDKFSTTDLPKMIDCEESIATPLDKFMVYDKGDYKKFLATPILTDDKCLSLDTSLDLIYLSYDSCTYTSDKLLSWDLVKVGHSGEFLLLHLYTKTCARANEDDGLVELANNCDENDAQMRWIFVESPVNTLGWFDNYDILRKPTQCP